MPHTGREAVGVPSLRRTASPMLAERAFGAGQRQGSDLPTFLLNYVSLAPHLARAKAARVLLLLLHELASDLRHASLAGDGISLVRLAPVLAALEGNAGLREAAREVPRVANWFP